jgi:Ser/Thr protein kinase RdoA (MazF antagonist)
MMSTAVTDWIETSFGAPVAETLFEISHLSAVTGVRLADGRELVVKVRGGVERARACVAGQAALHADGFACPAPLASVGVVNGLAVHAEEYVSGRRHSVEATSEDADDLASLLADLVGRSHRLALPRPAPAPMWMAWDHHGPGGWPPLEEQPPHPDAMDTEGWLTDIAERVRMRLSRIDTAEVVAHGDWEAQNMARRADDDVLIVHDWDSLVARPEPAVAGAAAATFASGEQPTLAPLEVSARFLDTYQRAAGRVFDPKELEVAWAAGLWLAAHNARMELLYGKPLAVTSRLAEEAPERLRRASA